MPAYMNPEMLRRYNQAHQPSTAPPNGYTRPSPGVGMGQSFPGSNPGGHIPGSPGYQPPQRGGFSGGEGHPLPSGGFPPNLLNPTPAPAPAPTPRPTSFQGYQPGGGNAPRPVQVDVSRNPYPTQSSWGGQAPPLPTYGNQPGGQSGGTLNGTNSVNGTNLNSSNLTGAAGFTPVGAPFGGQQGNGPGGIPSGYTFRGSTPAAGATGRANAGPAAIPSTGNPTADAAIAEAQRQQDAANAANEARYQQLLQINQQGGQQAATDINQSYAGLSGINQQNQAGQQATLSNNRSGVQGAIAGAQSGAQQAISSGTQSQRDAVSTGTDRALNLAGTAKSEQGSFVGAAGLKAQADIANNERKLTGLSKSSTKAEQAAAKAAEAKLLSQQAAAKKEALGYAQGQYGKVNTGIQQAGRAQQEFLGQQRDASQGVINAQSDADYQRERQQTQGEKSRLQQSLLDRGITNTTVGDSISQGIDDASALRTGEIGDRRINTRLGVLDAYAGRGLGSMSNTAGLSAGVGATAAGAGLGAISQAGQNSLNIGRDSADKTFNSISGANATQLGIGREAAGNSLNQSNLSTSQGLGVLDAYTGRAMGATNAATSANLGIESQATGQNLNTANLYGGANINEAQDYGRQSLGIQQQADTQELGLGQNYAGTRLAEDNSIRQDREGIIERKTDQGPNMALLASYLGQPRGTFGGGGATVNSGPMGLTGRAQRAEQPQQQGPPSGYAPQNMTPEQVQELVKQMMAKGQQPPPELLKVMPFPDDAIYTSLPGYSTVGG